jgi:hypothetical protein
VTSYGRPVRSGASLAFVCLTIALAVASGACSATNNASASTPATEIAVAGPKPSASAQMVCGSDGEKAIAATVGTDTVAPLVPTWKDHLYTCDYRYRGGARMTLSVKEMSSTEETNRYFDGLSAELGLRKTIPNLGEDAFQTRDGSVVVRKDYRVLLVDVSHLPARFDKFPRSVISNDVALALMECWTGA